MRFFKHIFDGQKEIERKKKEVSEAIHDQKNKFQNEMWKIQVEAHKIRNKQQHSVKDIDRLVGMVESVTVRIAEATGGINRTKRRKK